MYRLRHQITPMLVNEQSLLPIIPNLVEKLFKLPQITPDLKIGKHRDLGMLNQIELRFTIIKLRLGRWLHLNTFSM